MPAQTGKGRATLRIELSLWGQYLGKPEAQGLRLDSAWFQDVRAPHAASLFILLSIAVFS